MNKLEKIFEVTILLFIASCNNPIYETSTPPGLSDYFPLKVGNKWYYSYGSGSGNSLSGISKSGNLIWEVVGSTQLDKVKKEFKIQTLYTGREISHTYDATHQPPDHYDTTLHKNIKNSFTIISEKDTLFFRADSESLNSPKMDLSPFYRYNNPDIVGDTIKMAITADWYSYQKLKVNTGLIEYLYRSGHFGYYTGISITLDSVKLK